jgi:hypothetical protein
LEKDSSNGKEKGCGFGCGSLSIIAVLFLVGSYFFIESKLNSINEIEAGFDQLKEKYGKIESFVPYTDGVVPSDRIIKFIEIRNSISEERMELEESLINLSKELKTLEDGESFFETLLVIRELIKTIPDIVDYLAARNKKLLEMDLGLGEYYYIYVSSFYGWLNKLPGSGTDAIIIHRNENSISIGLTNDDKIPKYSGEEAIALRNQRITNEANKFIHRILSNLNNREITSGNDIIKSETFDSEKVRIEKSYLTNFKLFTEELEKSFSEIINPIEVIFISQ